MEEEVKPQPRKKRTKAQSENLELTLESVAAENPETEETQNAYPECPKGEYVSVEWNNGKRSQLKAEAAKQWRKLGFIK